MMEETSTKGWLGYINCLSITMHLCSEEKSKKDWLGCNSLWVCGPTIWSILGVKKTSNWKVNSSWSTSHLSILSSGGLFKSWDVTESVCELWTNNFEVYKGLRRLQSKLNAVKKLEWWKEYLRKVVEYNNIWPTFLKYKRV